MSIITTFQALSPDLPLVAEAAMTPNTRLTLGNILSADADQPVFIVAVRSDDIEHFERTLEESGAIESVSKLDPVDDRPRYRIRMAVPMPPVCADLARLDGVPGMTVVTDSSWQMDVQFPDRDAFVQFSQACLDDDILLHVERLSESAAPLDTARVHDLTPKQWEALSLAQRAGYFEIPRRISLVDLAAELDITEQSLSARLRRAQQQLVDDALSTRYGGI